MINQAAEYTSVYQSSAAIAHVDVKRRTLQQNPPYVTVKLSPLQVTGCFYLFDPYNYPVKPCTFVIRILSSGLISVPLFSGYRTGIWFSMTQQNKPEICGHMDWLLYSQWVGL